MKINPLPSLKVIKQLIELDPSSPSHLRWKSRDLASWNAKYANRPAGHRTSYGYWSVRLHRQPFLAHRLVYALHHNSTKFGEIDHKDGNGLNNSPSNLRRASRPQNCWNASKRGSASGYKWVSLCKATGRWRAMIRIGGVHTPLGRFTTPKAAHEAAKRAAIKHRKQFALRKP